MTRDVDNYVLPQSDEVTAIVIENGSSTTRVGFSGENSPRHIFPSVYGRDEEDNYYIGDEAVHSRVAGKEIYSPVTDGCVHDWTAMPKIWRYAYEEKLQIDPSELPLVTTEQTWNPSINRVKAIEAAFEDLQVPIFSIFKAPLCVAYDSARPTALVVDVGSAVAAVAPVVDGIIISKAAVHTRFAGDFINLHILSHLQSRNISLTPSYLIKQKASLDPGQSPAAQLNSFNGLTESYRSYEIGRILTEFKESTAEVSEVPFNSSLVQSRLGRPFEFPDGYNLTFGPERLTATEPLFKPNQYSLPGVTIPESSQGLIDLIYLSMSKGGFTSDVQNTLLNNVVVAGGTTLLQGLTNRLAHEISVLFPSSRAGLHGSAGAAERKSATWIGASILGSLGTFDQSWITKQEYEELGADLAEKRFK